MKTNDKLQNKKILNLVFLIVLFFFAFDSLVAFGSGLGAGFFDGLNAS